MQVVMDTVGYVKPVTLAVWQMVAVVEEEIRERENMADIQNQHHSNQWKTGNGSFSMCVCVFCVSCTIKCACF